MKKNQKEDQTMRVKWQIQNAHGMIKMNKLDAAESFMRTALKKRPSNFFDWGLIKTTAKLKIRQTMLFLI